MPPNVLRTPTSPSVRQERPEGFPAELVEARSVVASYRRRLEWILRVPEFEPLIELGVEELGLPRRRQGIGFRAAVDALALQHKYQLVRWAAVHVRRLLPSDLVRRWGQQWGLEAVGALEADERVSATQWETFLDAFVPVLGLEQRRYKRAQAALYTAHQHLVLGAAVRLVFDPHKRSDAMQEGSLALLAAIDRIDEAQEGFAAYAQQWIRRNIRNFLLRERLPVYAPINLVSDAVRGVDAAAAELLQPTVPLDDDREGHGEWRERLADPVAPAPAACADRDDLRELLERVLSRLTDKQQEVVRLRFGLGSRPDGLTLEQIAGRIGISHQQVSMREKRAIEKLASLLLPVSDELGV